MSMMEPTPDRRCEHEWHDDRRGDGRHCIHCGITCRTHRPEGSACVVCGWRPAYGV